MAFEACGRPKCKVTLQEMAPGFYSLAVSAPDGDGNGEFYLTRQYGDLDKADKEAIEGCERNATAKCTVNAHLAIPGKIATAPAARPAPVASESNCRPNTPTIRCSSRCTNGDCIVTYENGCKMRVQVSPRFDGFKNEWVYPSPSC